MNRFHNGAASHQQVWELLAWYVNGTATPEQHQIVARHLVDCDVCRAEHTAQRQLADYLQLDRVPVPDPAPGLARLLADIDRPMQGEPDKPMPQRLDSANWRWKLAVAGLATLALLQAGTLATLGIERADYQTLSSSEPAARHATIRLVPAPSMSVGQLQGILLRFGLQVVAGPTEAGVYSLAPSGATAEQASALAGLRSAPGVLFAEPVKATR